MRFLPALQRRLIRVFRKAVRRREAATRLKSLAGEMSLVPRVFKGVLAPAIGGALGIGVMTGLAGASATPLETVPFVTSIVLVISAPYSAQAQPRNILGGHVFSAVVGVIVGGLMGATPASAAIAVGLAIAAMVMTRTLHPPAAINAFMAVTQHLSWSFIFIPVAIGATILTGFAWLYHFLTLDVAWPINDSE